MNLLYFTGRKENSEPSSLVVAQLKHLRQEKLNFVIY